jgi:TonB-linked SusC/RagA family outer membrane protein
MWVNENILTYVNTFGKHHFNGMVALTQQSSRYQGSQAESQGFLNDNLQMWDMASGTLAITPTSGSNRWSLLSYLGRINYSYNDRYLFTASFRADGSSRFGKNNRWGYFPSAAIAWRASEEEFIKNLGIFSNLKLRSSYGWTGNQDGIGVYPSMALLGKRAYSFGDVKYMGYYPSQVANYDLKWETTKQTDLGIEAGFMDNKLNISADFYYKATHDLLLNVQIPSTSGYTTGLKNIGKVENKGVEITINASPFNKGFKWDVDFNITFNKNEVVNLGEVNEMVPTWNNASETDYGLNKSRLLRVGEPLGIFYGYLSDGIFGTDDDIASSAQPTAKPGDIRFKDLNDSGSIDDNDRVVLGSAQPDFFGGITNTFSYKNFDLSVFMTFSYGNEIYNGTKSEMESLDGSRNQFKTVLNRWTENNQNTNIPRAVNVKLTSRSWDHLVEDGSYLRIQNINLAYNIPPRVLSGTKLIRSLKLSVSLQNFFTFTNYSGLDPEVSRYGQNNVGAGYDYGAYPTAKTVLFGINANF